MKLTPSADLKAARRSRVPAVTCGGEVHPHLRARTQTHTQPLLHSYIKLASQNSFCVLTKTSPIQTGKTDLAVRGGSWSLSQRNSHKFHIHLLHLWDPISGSFTGTRNWFLSLLWVKWNISGKWDFFLNLHILSFFSGPKNVKLNYCSLCLKSPSPSVQQNHFHIEATHTEDHVWHIRHIDDIYVKRHVTRFCIFSRWSQIKFCDDPVTNTTISPPSMDGGPKLPKSKIINKIITSGVKTSVRGDEQKGGFDAFVGVFF